MKKSLLFFAATALVAANASAALTLSQAFPVDFSKGIPTGWAVTDDASTQITSNGLVITCSQESANYRADIKYNTSNTSDDLNIDINASEYKVFAITFYGERPTSGVLKLSNISVVGTGWIKGKDGFSLSEQGYTDIKDANNDHTYYWTIGGDNWTGELTIDKIEIVIADITSDSDKTYTVKGLNWFKNVDDLENSLTLNEETAVVNQTTGKGYADITAAWGAATDGDELLVNENQTINSRLNADSRNLTVTGKDATITITRATACNMMFLANGGNTITLKNLVLDGNNAETDANLTEASGWGTMAFDNVIVKNAKSSNALGLVVAKGGGMMNINNLTMQNCDVNEGAGEVFFGAAGSSLSGNNTMTVCIEASNVGSPINTSDLTNTDPIVLIPFNAEAFPADYSIIKCNADDASKFKLSYTGANLVYDETEGALLVKENSDAGVNEILDETTNAVYYNLQGVRVDNPGTGIYIRVSSGKEAKKICLK